MLPVIARKRYCLLAVIKNIQKNIFFICIFVENVKDILYNTLYDDYLWKKADEKKMKKSDGKVRSNIKKSKAYIFGIRNKIFICFLVPIIFMIILGAMSYQKAADGMDYTFQDSTQQTINMASEYIDMSNSFIAAETLKYVVDSELANYILGRYEDEPAERLSVMESQRLRIMASQVGNTFINNIYLIPEGNVQMITTQSKNQTSNYDEYMKEMQEISWDGEGIPKWIDRHQALDEYLKIDSSKYIMSCQMETQKGKAVIVIDVKTSAIQEFLDSLNLGEGSIVGFVTASGREIISETVADGGTSSLAKGQQVFADKDFFLQMESKDGVNEVQFKEDTYLFFHKKSEETGAVVCALVPKAIVTAQAESIKQMTVIGVILASVIAIIIGVLIAAGIRRNMKSISHRLIEVAGGNLTTTVKVRGRDEFRALAATANDMIANNKKLVLKVSQATYTLEESASEVAETSAVINEYSENIAQAIHEINEGMEMQSIHAQECVNKTDTLSAEILDVSRVASRVETLVESAEQMIKKGMELVKTLGERAQETTAVTARVEESIEELKEESEIINKFVATITEISDETNLLSLNASIEAARAGEAGRGFAVVAEEIRKLADSSAQAAGEIQRNVLNITSQTTASVESAKQAGAMVALQTEVVKEVTGVFLNMNESMEELFCGLKEILVSADQANKEKDDTLEAVRNISVIIEQTAASAEIVANVAASLRENVENLNGTAEDLGENMNGLKTEISVFKTE